MDPPDPNPPLTPVPQKKKKRELTGKERQQIVLRLLFEMMQNLSVDGKFLRGTLTVVGGEFHVTWRTISRVWARAQEIFQNPDILKFHSSPRIKKCGRHKNGTMMKFAKLLLLSPFLREGPSGTLLMLLEYRSLRCGT